MYVLLSGGGVFKSQGGDFPQSLPVCVIKIWREMGPFSTQIGTGGVCPYAYVFWSFSNMGSVFSI